MNGKTVLCHEARFFQTKIGRKSKDCMHCRYKLISCDNSEEKHSTCCHFVIPVRLFLAFDTNYMFYGRITIVAFR